MYKELIISCENTHIATIRYLGIRVFLGTKVSRHFLKLSINYLPGARLLNSGIPLPPPSNFLESQLDLKYGKVFLYYLQQQIQFQVKQHHGLNQFSEKFAWATMTIYSIPYIYFCQQLNDVQRTFSASGQKWKVEKKSISIKIDKPGKLYNTSPF